MKDSEFIELLNLYLDHEISAADAARLEAEVQGNPARRRIYQDYCRMQKACTLLAENFQVEAAAITDRKVVAFDPAFAAATERRRRMGNFYVIGAIAAAAACIAIVFVGRSRERAVAATPAAQIVRHEISPASAPVEATAPVTIDAARAIASTVSTTPAHRATATTGLTNNALSLTSNAQANALRAAAAGQADAQFAWMNGVNLAPLPQRIPIEQIRFDTQPAVIRTESRTFGNQQLLPTDIERAAFRFQK